jgi:sugar (pentulose or hexulose) kinase
MNPCLLLDCGATRIKAALLDLPDGLLRERRDYTPPPSVATIHGRYELPIDAILSQFNEICTTYFQLAGNLHGIFLCSQMHGFALQDISNRTIVTNYISWQDERSLETINGEQTFSRLSVLTGKRYRAITGMPPRPGLPYFNLAHLVKEQGLQGEFRLLSLPDIVSGGDRAHLTMLAGTGFFDLTSGAPSHELIEIFNEFTGNHIDLSFPGKLGETEAVSVWKHVSGLEIPIFPGVGDHQTALLGAGVRKATDCSVNVGTGAQVSVIAPPWHPDTDRRPYFQGDELSTITHIPAGRSLVAFVGFLEECSGGFVHSRAYWSQLESLTADEILSSDLEINLAIFKSAWHFNSGGDIKGISESNFTLHNFLASLIKSLALQFVAAIKVIDPDNKTDRIVLSGGIPQKIRAFIKVLEELCAVEVVLSVDEEETLAGLKELVLLNIKSNKGN